MQAIILAAGMGKRLKELTQDNTKCMVKVCGETLIERMLRQQEKLGLAFCIYIVNCKTSSFVSSTSFLPIFLAYLESSRRFTLQLGALLYGSGAS